MGAGALILFPDWSHSAELLTEQWPASAARSDCLFGHRIGESWRGTGWSYQWMLEGEAMLLFLTFLSFGEQNSVQTGEQFVFVFIWLNTTV